jgi:regulator of nucleoside diphosphate kinase
MRSPNADLLKQRDSTLHLQNDFEHTIFSRGSPSQRRLTGRLHSRRPWSTISSKNRVQERRTVASQGEIMSRALPPVIIPAPDYARLEQLVRTAWSDQHPGAIFLLSEIRRDRVVDQEICRDEIVPLNRWVTYRLDRAPCESRTLVHAEDYVSPEHQLSVLSPVGAALIGIKVGDRMPYLSIEGEFHVVIAVSIDAPVKFASFAQDARRVRIKFEDEPFDSGPQAV